MLHCKNLGIPNPYSYGEYIKADQRWKKLHKNAAPSILELTGTETHLEENKNIKILSLARNKRAQRSTGDFVF